MTIMHKTYYCFPEGKHKVLTMSYDDGKLQDRRLVSLFNEYQIKGTFHINGGLLENQERLKRDEIYTLYTGHEIACHTLTHPTIARCPKEQIVNEVLKDREILEEITGTPVRGLSYPNGSYSEQIKELLPFLGIAYSRTVNDTGKFDLPNDFMEWNPTCHHNINLVELGQEFLDLHKTQYLYMMYVWGHSYDFERDNNWEVIETFCKMISGKEDIWYATNIEIVDYLHAVENLIYTASGNGVYNPSALDVWISVDNQVIKLEGGKYTSLF